MVSESKSFDLDDYEEYDEYYESKRIADEGNKTFLKFRKPVDRTRAGVEIPKKSVRISPTYKLYKVLHSKLEPLEPWYELSGAMTTKTRKLYTQHWFIAQSQPYIDVLTAKHSNYLESLNEEQKDTLIGYTFIGDTIINNFMRNLYGILSSQIYRIFRAIEHKEYPKLPLDWQIYHFFEYLTKSGVKTSYKKADLIRGEELQRKKIHEIFTDNVDWFSNPRNIEPLVTDLILKTINIILKAPRTRFPIKVYRGIKTEHINSLNFISSDFWSTSFIPSSALKFTALGFENIYGTIYEITIKPGVPCLYISDISKYSNEFEILLPPFIQYRTSDIVNVKGIYTEEEYNRDPPDVRKEREIKKEIERERKREREKEKESHIPNRYGYDDNDYSNYYNNISIESDEYILYSVGTITVIADKFNEKGIQYLERKRHWRNVKEEADIDDYLEKVARKEKYNLLGVPVDDESLVPISSRRSIRKKMKSARKSVRKHSIRTSSTRKSTKRNSFKRRAREEERRKTHKLKRSARRIPTTTNNSNM